MVITFVQLPGLPHFYLWISFTTLPSLSFQKDIVPCTGIGDPCGRRFYMQRKKYKVLLNAGGGCFGYIITYLMSQLKEDVYKHIDVAAGTSIGGILTLLYAVNSDYKYIN